MLKTVENWSLSFLFRSFAYSLTRSLVGWTPVEKFIIARRAGQYNNNMLFVAIDLFSYFLIHFSFLFFVCSPYQSFVDKSIDLFRIGAYHCSMLIFFVWLGFTCTSVLMMMIIMYIEDMRSMCALQQWTYNILYTREYAMRVCGIIYGWFIMCCRIYHWSLIHWAKHLA